MANKQRLVIEAVLLILIVGGLLRAQGPQEKAKEPIPDVVRAREFQMVDQEGKVLAAMRMNSAMDGPIVQAKGFHVVDDTGYVRAALRLDGSEGGPEVTFWSKDHKRRVAELSINSEDQAMLILMNQDGRHQINLVTSNNGPTLSLADAEGHQAEILLTAPRVGKSEVLVGGKALSPQNQTKNEARQP